ncbi:MAG: hypothetical protein ACI9UN_002382 [Granulosicoccus sp.]
MIINTVPNTNNIAIFQEYYAQMVELIMKHGGKGMQRFRIVEQVLGVGGVKAAAVFEFPSADAIREMVACKAFTALNDLRAKAFAQVPDLMICEDM